MKRRVCLARALAYGGDCLLWMNLLRDWMVRTAKSGGLHP